MSPKRSGQLSDEDRIIWAKVARTAKPLSSALVMVTSVGAKRERILSRSRRPGTQGSPDNQFGRRATKPVASVAFFGPTVT